MRRILGSFVFLAAATAAGAQQLPPPPVPAENPLTEPKRVLGKILFWDEQLSSDDTVACGTCHDMRSGGADARTAIHPGLDGQFGTPDDVVGSPGVVRRDANGDPIPDLVFGHRKQVTPRAANPVIDAAYGIDLFWDGRATSTFVDPQTGAISIVGGGALESQAVGPIVSDVEMAKENRTWDDVIAELETATPLALAADVPADVAAVLSAGPSYPDLFQQAFGDSAITSERIAFALATYQRTLIANQTPWDRFIAGDPQAMTPSQTLGWNTFQASPCGICHTPPFFTNHDFRNIGLRPVAEDPGREGVTGNLFDRGRFKVPSLRNVGLKRTFMHTGEFTTLDQVITFYGPGNQVLDNLDPLMPVPPPPNLPQVIDFLANGLTDRRVVFGTFPFDRPSLFEGRDPHTLLFFEADRATIHWPEPLGVSAWRLYRGDLAALPGGGWGDCVTALDPDDTDTTFVDATLPAPGQALFYLKAFVDGSGESGLGSTSLGADRVPTTACP